MVDFLVGWLLAWVRSGQLAGGVSHLGCVDGVRWGWGDVDDGGGGRSEVIEGGKTAVIVDTVQSSERVRWYGGGGGRVREWVRDWRLGRWGYG